MARRSSRSGTFEGRLPVVAAPFALALALSLAVAGDASPTGELRLVDLDGQRAAPFADAAPATVFVFVRTDCPISNRYAPELRRLHERFAPRGVRFWLVYADPSEPIATLRAHLSDYGYPMAALRDPHHDLVRGTGAEVTPEAVLFDQAGQRVYRGRIDDRYVDFGQARPAASQHDLERAIEAVLAGSLPEVQTTRAVGCFIPPLE